jgi:hypothetical protein
MLLNMEITIPQPDFEMLDLSPKTLSRSIHYSEHTAAILNAAGTTCGTVVSKRIGTARFWQRLSQPCRGRSERSNGWRPESQRWRPGKMRWLLGLFFAFAGGLAAQYVAPLPNLSTVTTTLGGQLSWSVNNVIAYSYPLNGTGYFELYTINPNGTGNTCITCSTSPGVGVLQNVWVTQGTDNSLPNSGTWTITGGGSGSHGCSGAGANGTFTASGGNLKTVTILCGGTGYNTATSNPTFVPSSGSLGTSTVYFPVLSGLHAGNPKWTRTGNYIIFMDQSGPNVPSTGNTGNFQGFPGEGAWNELWATDTRGNFWQLTNQVYNTYSVNYGGTVSGGTCSPANYTATVTYAGGSPSGTGSVAVSGNTIASNTPIKRTGGGLYSTSTAPASITISGCTGFTFNRDAVMSGSGGVIYPAISWDNTKWAWGQRLIPGQTPGDAQNPGKWELAIGTWQESGNTACIVGNAAPCFTAINYYGPYQPGGAQGYYEPHGWSLDNSTVFFMAQTLTPGISNNTPNIYSYNPTSGAFSNLNNDPYNWNEYPTPLPSSFGSNKLIYTTHVASAFPFSDYWVMNYDGTDKYQLTFFNTPGSAQFFAGGNQYTSAGSWTNTRGNIRQVFARANARAASGGSAARSGRPQVQRGVSYPSFSGPSRRHKAGRFQT